MEQKDKNCKSCNQKLSSTQLWITALSIYILGTSVYGTVQLYHLLVDFVK